MMKKIMYWFFAVGVGLTLLTSCGPSEENVFGDVDDSQTTPQYIIDYNKAFELHNYRDYPNAVYAYEQALKAIDALKPEKKNTDTVKDVYKKSVMGAALCYGNLNNIDSAKKYFTQYQTMWPNELDGYLKFGGILERNNLPEEAYAQYKKAMDLDPTNATAEFALAKIYKDDKKFDQAITFFEAGLKKQPNFQDGNGWFMLGDTYREKGDYVNQVKAYERMVQLRSDDWQAYYYLAQAYRVIGEKTGSDNKDWRKLRIEYYTKSVDNYKKGLSLKADSDGLMRGIAGSYQNLAEMFKGKKEFNQYYQESVKYLIIFTQNKPNDYFGFALLAEAYSKLGNAKDALENAQISVKINSDSTSNAMGYSVLGDVYFSQGAWPAARNAYLNIVNNPSYVYVRSRIEICEARIRGEY